MIPPLSAQDNLRAPQLPASFPVGVSPAVELTPLPSPCHRAEVSSQSRTGGPSLTDTQVPSPLSPPSAEPTLSPPAEFHANSDNSQPSLPPSPAPPPLLLVQDTPSLQRSSRQLPQDDPSLKRQFPSPTELEEEAHVCADDIKAEAHWREHLARPPPEFPPDIIPPPVRKALRKLATLSSPSALQDHVDNWFTKMRKRAVDLKHEQKAWARAMPDSVRTIAGHLHLPLMNELLASFDYSDRKALVKDFRNGFRIRGEFPVSGIFGSEPGKPPNERLPQPIAFTRRPTPHCPADLHGKVLKENHKEVLDFCKAEVEGLWVEGPFLREAMPFEKFYPALRFLVEQDTSHGAEPFRPVDDLSANGCNTGVFMPEKLKLISVDAFAQFAEELYRQFPPSEGWPPLHVFKVDLAKAFKQAPLHPIDRPFAVVTAKDPQTEEHNYYIHRVLPFGAAAAPYQFSRIAHALASIARECLGIPLFYYLDDFFCAAPGSHDPTQPSLAKILYKAFRDLLDLLGFKTKEAKCSPPKPKEQVLGVAFSFGESTLSLSIDEGKKDRTLALIRAHLTSDKLDAMTAAKLAGRLAWAASVLSGRLGRAFLHPLYVLASIHSSLPDAPRHPALKDGGIVTREGTIGPRLRNALRWWIALLLRGPPRLLRPGVRRRPFEAWTDASLLQQGVGGLWAESGQPASTQAFGTSIEGHLLGWLPSTLTQRQIIFQLELMAVLLLIRFAGPEISGHALRVWVDNEGARYGIIAGYSGNSFGARIIAQIWVEAARHDLALWVERVPTKENPADSLSRLAFSLARRLQWRLLSASKLDTAVAELEDLLFKPWAELGLE